MKYKDWIFNTKVIYIGKVLAKLYSLKTRQDFNNFSNKYYNSISNREIVHKNIYLLQHFKENEFRYEYSWHMGGIYSIEISKDIYELANLIDKDYSILSEILNEKYNKTLPKEEIHNFINMESQKVIDIIKNNTLNKLRNQDIGYIEEYKEIMGDKINNFKYLELLTTVAFIINREKIIEENDISKRVKEVKQKFLRENIIKAIKFYKTNFKKERTI